MIPTIGHTKSITPEINRDDTGLYPQSAGDFPNMGFKGFDQKSGEVAKVIEEEMPHSPLAAVCVQPPHA